MEDKRIKAVKNWPKPNFVYDIQIFLSFANFYQYFIQSFGKIAGPLTLMLKILSLTGSWTMSQLINAVDEYEIDDNKSGGNETNLSNLSPLKKSTRTGYLTFGGAKRGGGNTKKGVEAAKSSYYLILAAKKAFNHLQHAFIQTPIFQHFDPKRHI